MLEGASNDGIQSALASGRIDALLGQQLSHAIASTRSARRRFIKSSAWRRGGRVDVAGAGKQYARPPRQRGGKLQDAACLIVIHGHVSMSWLHFAAMGRQAVRRKMINSVVRKRGD